MEHSSRGGSTRAHHHQPGIVGHALVAQGCCRQPSGCARGGSGRGARPGVQAAAATAAGPREVTFPPPWRRNAPPAPRDPSLSAHGCDAPAGRTNAESPGTRPRPIASLPRSVIGAVVWLTPPAQNRMYADGSEGGFHPAGTGRRERSNDPCRLFRGAPRDGETRARRPDDRLWIRAAGSLVRCERRGWKAADADGHEAHRATGAPARPPG